MSQHSNVAVQSKFNKVKRLLTLHFNGHFTGGPGLAGTRMSSFWIYWS